MTLAVNDYNESGFCVFNTAAFALVLQLYTGEGSTGCLFTKRGQSHAKSIIIPTRINTR